MSTGQVTFVYLVVWCPFHVGDLGWVLSVLKLFIYYAHSLMFNYMPISQTSFFPDIPVLLLLDPHSGLAVFPPNSRLPRTSDCNLIWN